MDDHRIGRLRLDWEISRRGFQRFAAYPAATLAGMFTNTVFGFMRGYILLAVFAHRTDVGGYDAQRTITYAWLTQALIATISIWGWEDLALRIRSGDIATDLSRPIHPLRYGLDFDLGRALYHLVFRGIPPLILGAIVFDLTAPSKPLVWLALAVSVVVAVCVSFAFRFLYNTVAFWTTDYRGASVMAMLAANLLSGFIMPIAFFPGWLRTVANATPFPAMMQIPVDIFVGKTTGAAVAGALAIQVGWAVAMLALAYATFAAGSRRVVVQGG